jgi:hypothetical protein
MTANNFRIYRFFRGLNVGAYHQIVLYGNLATQAKVGIFLEGAGQVFVLHLVALCYLAGDDFHPAGSAQAPPPAVQYLENMSVDAQFVRNGRFPEVGSRFHLQSSLVIFKRDF